MSFYLVAGAVFLVFIGVALFSRYAPVLFLDALDHLIMHLPMKPFLAMTPTRDPVVGSLVMAAVLVCGLGLILSLSRQTGLWIVWPVTALFLFCAVGFGVVFATMVWPVVLTSGLIVLWFALGVLERAGGEPVPFPGDGPRVSILNVMIVLTPLLAGYASALAMRARKTTEQHSSRH
jgi:hypothetical protein